MSEVDVLQSLLNRGYRPSMHLERLNAAEVRELLPQQFWDKEVKALTMRSPDGAVGSFLYTTPEADEIVRRLVEEQSAVTGYFLCVYCCAVGTDATAGRQVELKGLIGDLHALTNWDIRESKYPNVFEVHSYAASNDKSALEERVNEVERVCLALSLKNGLGFQISTSSHPTFVGQACSIVAGLVVRLPETVSTVNLEALAHVESDERRLSAALALRDVYSQVTTRTQLIVAWAAVEDLFRSSATHVLGADGLLELSQIIEGVLGAPEGNPASERIIKVLQNADLVPAKSRNERLAERIAPVLGADEKAVYADLRQASAARGKVAHSAASDADLREPIAFLIRVLEAVVGDRTLFRHAA
jgi:hypothetical protein